MVRGFFACLIFGALWASSSCSSETPKFDDGEVIHTDSIPVIQVHTKNNLGPFDIDTLIDSRTLEIIQLQTDDRSTFAAAERFFSLADEGYLIADLTNDAVLIFDNHGSFIRRIGELGKGPGEYGRVTNLRYNPLKESVDIYDTNWKFLQFSLMGELLEERSPMVEGFFNSSFFPLDADAYLLYNDLGMREDPDHRFRVAYVDDGQLQWRKFGYSAQESELKFTTSHSLFHAYRDTVRFFERFIPVVYNISRDGLSPRFAFDFGEGQQGPYYVNNMGRYIRASKTDKGFVCLSKIFESDRFMLVELGMKKDKTRGYCIVDKANGNRAVFGYGGYNLGEVKLYLKAVEGNRLYAVVAATDVIARREYLQNGVPRDSWGFFDRMIADMDVKATDNDIIVSVDLRK